MLLSFILVAMLQWPEKLFLLNNKMSTNNLFFIK